MSHDRCCFKCWKEPWEWINCSDKNCVKKIKEISLQNKSKIEMKNEMIERVAKAIKDECLKCIQKNQFGKFKTDVWENYARAAIQAMYVPTDQQRNFYFDLKRNTGSTSAYSTFEDATWEMMILACLMQDTIDDS